MTDQGYRKKSKGDLKVLTAAGIITSITIVVEVTVGLLSNSLALLANAAHDFSDGLAVAVSITAAFLITKRPTDKKTFGYLRTSILATVFNAGVIGFTAVLLVIFAIDRELHPAKVTSLNLIVVGLISAVSNLAAALVTNSNSGPANKSKRKLNLLTASTAMHFILDAVGSFLIVAVGVATLADKSLSYFDPTAAIIISIFALYTTYKLIIRSWDILMEATPTGINLEEVVKSIESFDSISNVHDVHIWSISSDYYAMSAHITLDNNCRLDSVQELIGSIKVMLNNSYHIDHLTIEPETQKCEISETNCL